MNYFDDLIGQSHVVERLNSAVKAANSGEESQEMTHAWIFTGPPGSGRSSAAVAFAAALVGSALPHPDVEVMKNEGLSIKVDEVRELLARVSWAPSVAQWRVVVMEDADRLTESAANALLKAIEEPGVRTVWLLCAPTLHDILPTIRSRCRHIQLRTPSNHEVAEYLETKNGVAPKMAQFAARVSQGHIGRARHIAMDEAIRNRRNTILNLPMQLTNIAGAYSAAATLVDLANEEADAISEKLDEKEQEELAQAWGKGATGRGIASGGAKALKELEKEQKSRSTRIVRDTLDNALLDLATFYRDALFVLEGQELINQDLEKEIKHYAQNTAPEKTVKKLGFILSARDDLSRNSAPLLTMEALMCQLAS